MTNKLYVGNLSYSTTEDSLRAFFSEAGEVTSATVITDRNSGRSKGFGFVEMSSADEASKAIDMFDNKELDGRNIRVSEAKPKEEKRF